MDHGQHVHLEALAARALQQLPRHEADGGGGSAARRDQLPAR